MSRSRFSSTSTTLVCNLVALPIGFGGFHKHEIVNGVFRDLSCETLQECIDKGISTPGILAHRAWTLEIDDALRLRRDRLEGLNQTALLARQRHVRAILRRRLLRASLPSSKPPRFRIVRQFTDLDRGVHVSLLLFETWPGHAVPSALFEPLGAHETNAQLPAILHLPGHLASALRHPEEQVISLKLAQRGYIVLSFDPISQGERLQYSAGSGLECDTRCPPADEMNNACLISGPPCSRAHDHFGKQLWLLGKSAAELFLRDAQRALDLLISLPSVDATRIGAVGCSGGGMLTAYLGAVDNRVAATCVACYFSTLQRELDIGNCNYDAEQILWRQVNYGIDKPDMIIARAPNPTLVLLTTYDCFPMLGGREGFEMAAQTFHSYDRQNWKLYLSEAGGYHEMTFVGNNALNEFFDNELEGAGNAAAAPTSRIEQPFPCHMLWIGGEEVARGVDGNTPRSTIVDLLRASARPLLSTLRARRRVAHGSTNIGNSDRSIGSSRWLRSLPRASARLAGLDDDVIDELVRALRGEKSHPLMRQFMRYFSGGSEEWFLMYTGRTCAVTLRLFRREFAAASDVPARPVAMMFGGGALLNRELSIWEESLIMELLLNGFDVVVVGLCGLGDKLWRTGLWEYAPLLLGKTHAGRHAAEMLRVLTWSVAVLGARRVVLIASGGATSALLHAALQVPLAEQRAVRCDSFRSNSSGSATTGHLHNNDNRSSAPQTRATARLGSIIGVVAGVVLVRGICSLADVVLARRHRMPWSMQMYGNLEHYDLPDLLAALGATASGRDGIPRALVIAPRGGNGKALSAQRASRAYELARRQLGAHSRYCKGHLGQRQGLRVIAAGRSVNEEVHSIASFASASVACSPAPIRSRRAPT